MPNNEERDFYKSWGEESKVRKENMKKQAERDAKIAETLDYLSKTIKDFKVSSEKTLQNVAKATKLNELGSHVGNVAKESFKEYGNEARTRGSQAVGDVAGAVLASLGPYGYLAEKTLGFGKSVGGTLNKFLGGSKKSKSESDSEDKSLDAVVQAIRGEDDGAQKRVYNKLELWLDYQEEKDKRYSRFIDLVTAFNQQEAENQKKLLEEQKKAEKENKKFRTLQMAKTGLLIAGVTALTGAVVLGGFMLYKAIKEWNPLGGLFGNKGTKDNLEKDTANFTPFGGDKRSKEQAKTQADSLRVTSSYGWRKHPTTGEWKEHQGVDIAGRAGDKNIPVKASFDGTVILAGWIKGYGKVVKLEGTLSDGVPIRQLYAHLADYYVKKGQKVTQGQVIGVMGNTGIGTGIHLHTEVELLQNGKWSRVDPESIKTYKGVNGNTDLLSLMKEQTAVINKGAGVKAATIAATQQAKQAKMELNQVKEQRAIHDFEKAINSGVYKSSVLPEKSRQLEDMKKAYKEKYGMDYNVSLTQPLSTDVTSSTTGSVSTELDKTKLSMMNPTTITSKGKNSVKLASNSIAYNTEPVAKAQQSSNQNSANTTVVQTPQVNNQETTTLAFGVNEPLAKLTRGNVETFV